jgi:hypothetical protein
MLILLPLALCALAEGGWKVRNLRLKQIAALVAVTAGAAAYPAFLWYRWGSPLLYIQNKTTTGTQSVLPPTHLLGTAFRNAIRNFSSPTSGGQIRFWLEIGSLLGFAVLSFLLFRRRLVPEGCYCAATLLLFSCTGTLDGVHRYVLALFPCFFLIGDLLRRAQTAQFVYRYAGASLNTILIARFAHWAWVA